MKSNSLAKTILILSSLEGIAAFLMLFWIPSMDRNAFLFGYSLSRVLMGTAVLLILLPLTWLTLRALQSQTRMTTWLSKLDGWLQDDGRLLSWLTALLAILLVGAGSFVLFSSPSGKHLDMMQAVFWRAAALPAWASLLALQVLAFLLYHYRQRCRSRSFYRPAPVLRALLVLALLAVTVFHWLILYLQIDVLFSIPHWYWKFWPKPFSARDLLFGVMALLALAAVWYVLRSSMRSSNRPIKALILLILLGTILQVGFGFIEGEGFQSLHRKYVKYSHYIYAQYAADKPAWNDILLHYDEIHGEDMYLDTKPPGLLLFYMGVQDVVDTFTPGTDYESRYHYLTQFMTYVFPLLSFLVLIPLYYLARSYLGEDDALLAGLLYILLPNVLLMVLEIDQVLFPLLFSGGLLLWKKTMQDHNLLLAVLTGAYAYIAVYLTYSMLPLFPLLGLWLGFEFLFNRKQMSFKQAFRLGLGLLAGFLVLFVLFRLLFNYDFFLRYQNAMLRHHFHKKYEPGFQQVVKAFVLNNIEMIIWCGVPFSFLAGARIFRALVSPLHRKLNQLDILILAFAFTYLALNLLGQTRSEVARLWLFMLPLVSIFTADEIRNLFKNRSLAVFSVAFMQLITIYLTYKFQDSLNK